MLLATYRQVSAQKAVMGLVGLSEDIQDTMSATGFLSFFTIYNTIADGLVVLK
jgi:anti-sigma B factor antagonist